jgi:dUTP pyrophosphatase
MTEDGRPPMHARITRLDPDVPLPAYETAGAAGFDFAAWEDAVVGPGEIRLIRTGLVIEVPTGYFLGIFIRSSSPLRRKLVLANGVGVVDSDYSGPQDEVRIQVLNTGVAPVAIARGERIAQGLFIPVQQVVWQEVAAIREVSRGGFGSTG